MIQRVQTLYLFAASILSTAGAFFAPIYTVDTAVEKATIAPWTFGLFGLCMSLFSLSILLYKNRKTQLLLVRLGMLAALGELAAILILIKNTAGAQATWGAVLPMVILVAAVLASRGIQKDEQTVRSYDRLR